MKINMTGPKWIFAASVLVSAVLLFVFRWGTINDSGPGIYLIDHWTGRVYWANRQELIQVQEPAAPVPKQLTADELDQLLSPKDAPLTFTEDDFVPLTDDKKADPEEK